MTLKQRLPINKKKQFVMMKSGNKFLKKWEMENGFVKLPIKVIFCLNKNKFNIVFWNVLTSESDVHLKYITTTDCHTMFKVFYFTGNFE